MKYFNVENSLLIRIHYTKLVFFINLIFLFILVLNAVQNFISKSNMIKFLMKFLVHKNSLIQICKSEHFELYSLLNLPTRYYT